MQENDVGAMEGVESTNPETSSPPLLTDQERRILGLYDRSEELQLEIALLKAQGVLSRGMWYIEKACILSRVLTTST
jgi:hypothetical protein